MTNLDDKRLDERYYRKREGIQCREVNNKKHAHHVVLLFLLNGQNATSLLIVAQERFNFPHITKRLMTQKLPSRCSGLIGL